MYDEGAEAIILGCTELPMAINYEALGDKMLNSDEILAQIRNSSRKNFWPNSLKPKSSRQLENVFFTEKGRERERESKK